ncbi:hypothetical protein [Massilia sp. Root1485]|uniref:hypothetical protein n=1 Tax=Massilia sp. Root1485 TaxID=1736472 RepID=UPI000AA40FDE|nr:hypothetical protein [Massilia sp. Root1485]
MYVHHLTGLNMVAERCDSRKASIHAGSTGLTGLAGYPGAHVNKISNPNQDRRISKNILVRTVETTLTLLTMFKASIHAGFSVTGFRVNTVMPRKGA